MSSVVLFDTINTTNGFTIGIATLNQPQVLNGFSLEMATLLQQQMNRWEQDQSVVAVVLRGAGDKAFCAGGDLHALYKSMLENQTKEPWANRAARDFFEHEYRLDYHIHSYTKPVICYGDGIVMGGGMGLMMGASHRVVTETTRMAMPEISIGLFPDVGGSWLLNRLPGKTGKFLAATGAQVGAKDALFLGMADYYIDRASWETVLVQLQQQAWSAPSQRTVNDELIHQVLVDHVGTSLTSTGPVETHYAQINALSRHTDKVKQYEVYAKLANHEDEWLARAAKTMLKGAPISFALAMDLLDKTKHLSLADIFRLEFNAAVHSACLGQFQEGIRALLIDKDKNPQWNPSSVADVSREQLDYFYEDPMPEGVAHPLADLG
ncbi:enoyl-CoA hydratase/isomerase family protein [Pelistega europaea]|uniref:3-hydroxyisobutyryl-CoA hydrolase n=1 Tax=Pelistega europaea TaxID=106147 RepID=A0A7Y4P5P8_9BURK|nr:enoyl-CoA hydratase/isomerase family protein [Pelistega europaea]NOL48945.1 enoyl-CoA hydratase/isomerase family protein [Pelistega europaea]